MTAATTLDGSNQAAAAPLHRYRVSGMDCAKDAAQIERAAQGAGVASEAVKVSAATHVMTLRAPEADLSRIEAAVAETGYGFERIAEGEDPAGASAAHQDPGYRRALWIVVGLNVGYGIVEMIGHTGAIDYVELVAEYVTRAEKKRLADTIGAQSSCDAVVAVTMLTSLDERDLARTGIEGSPHDHVLRLADLAHDAGLDGIVCSGQEVGAVHKQWKDGFFVVPGLRPAGAAAGDQKRTVTPRSARDDGASVLVIGRPISRAEDPLAAARAIEATL